MSRVNPRIVYWLAELYKQPEFSAAHRDILTYLAIARLDYGTGSGYCSAQSLADALDRDERTVRRALDLARQANPPLLTRTRRGHRRGDGTVAASEWQIIYPPISTGHGDPVDTAAPVDNRHSTGQSCPVDNASTGQDSTSQPGARARPTGSEGSTGSEVSLSAALAELRQFDPTASKTDAKAILEILKARGARSPMAVLRCELRDGQADALLAECRRLHNGTGPHRSLRPLRLCAMCRSDDHEHCKGCTDCEVCRRGPAPLVSTGAERAQAARDAGRRVQAKIDAGVIAS